MNLLAPVLLCACLFVGCQNAQPAFDPFLGRSTIPPPGTAIPQGANAYVPTAPPPITQPPMVTPGAPVVAPNVAPPTYFSPNPATPIPQPGAVAPPAPPPLQNPHDTSPAGLNYQQTSLQQKTASQLATAQPAASRQAEIVDLDRTDSNGNPGALRSPNQWQPIDRVAMVNASTGPTAAVNATPMNTAAMPATVPTRLAVPDVPPVGSTLPASYGANSAQQPPVGLAYEQRTPGDTVRVAPPATLPGGAPAGAPQVIAPKLVDLPMPAAGSLQSVPASVAPPAMAMPQSAYLAATPTYNLSSSTEQSRAGATFSHDPTYRELQGKLEFSPDTNRWRIRYAPLGSQPDEFGGTVIVSEASPISGFEAGDFVAVQGSIGPRVSDGRTVAPSFTVSRIKRQ